jgi:hypothetical protein
MRRAVVSVEELRASLRELALTAAGSASGRRRGPDARDLLNRSIGNAIEILDAEVAGGIQLGSADELVRAWLNAGGDWQDLIIAVNRAARAGASTRNHMEKTDG